MLAERKVKKKFSLNPRGTDWVNDQSKFGQQLLEKMGWKKGKGLGLNEDGITEHIGSSGKIDNKEGIGCKGGGGAGETWLAAQDEYSSILANLNELYGTKKKVDDNKKENFVNLEEKCKNSKSRVYYSKVIKSKNLATKDKKDLDCIFGWTRRAMKEMPKPIKDEDEDESEPEEESKEKLGVKITSNDLNMSDYFSKKMADLRKAKHSSETKQVVEHVETGKGGSENVGEEPAQEKPKEKKRKKRNASDTEIVEEITEKPKKKRKKENAEGYRSVDIVPVDDNKVREKEISEETEKNHKKSKKSIKRKPSTCDPDVKESNAIVNEVINVTVENVETNISQDDDSSKKRKKKKAKND